MFVAEVRACIDEHAMLPYGAHVIVAVSGGADSVALLSALYQLRARYGLTFTVVHINHQLRGEESRRDALFVEQYAARLGMPCYVETVDVKALQRTQGLSPQHAARELRYACFARLWRTLSATRVALGHTANDQTETILVRLVRGSGPAGFAGIPPVRLPYIRPLIRVGRGEVEAYLTAEGLPWVEDSTNAHRAYLRNRIRLDLVPTLREYNPQIDTRLHELADMLRAESCFLEQHTDALLSQVISWQQGGRLLLRSGAFCAAPLALQRRVLRRISDTVFKLDTMLGFRHIETLRRLFTEATLGKQVTLPGGWRAARLPTGVLLWPGRRLQPKVHVFSLPVPGRIDIPECALQLSADVLAARPCCLTAGAGVAYVDLQRLQLPLTVRYRQPGDRFHPLGAPGHKKLKDFFIDRKVPKAERHMIPLVMSGVQIVWVVGYRLAEPFKVRPDTQRVVRLCCDWWQPS